MCVFTVASARCSSCAISALDMPLASLVRTSRIAYFILPAGLIPEYILVIGFIDDAAVLAGAIKIVNSHITPDHREAARRALARLRGEA